MQGRGISLLFENHWLLHRKGVADPASGGKLVSEKKKEIESNLPQRKEKFPSGKESHCAHRKKKGEKKAGG